MEQEAGSGNARIQLLASGTQARGPSVLEGPGGPEASLLLRPHK